MKITLANGTELQPYVVTGARKQIQGQNRDTLSFYFPASAGMAELDQLFTHENCESIAITDDSGEEFIHKGYTIRGELCLKSVLTVPETAENSAEYEDRIIVTMAQRTWQESQLAALTAIVTALSEKYGV